MNEVTVAEPSRLTVHPAAALFPMLEETELAELAADIRANGLYSPVVVKDGQILDGRNRLRACQLADVPARFVEWEGHGSVALWIFSVNLHRRHLTPSQRAILAARAIEVFEREARERQQRGLVAEESGRSREKAAEMLGVGEASVARAQQVITKGAPELVAAVESGDVPVKTAAQLVSLPAEEQRTVVREKKVTERVKEEREKRHPRHPPRHSEPPPSLPVSSPTASSASADNDNQDEDEEEHEEAESDDEQSTLDLRNRPEPQPLNAGAFRAEYRKGNKPKDEAAKVDQILVAARSALHTWRWIAIEWTEDKRWDMKFALNDSGQIAHHLQQAVAKLEEISAVCNGKKPAPPPERR